MGENGRKAWNGLDNSSSCSPLRGAGSPLLPVSSSFQGFLLHPSSPPSLLLSPLQCHVAYCCHSLCFRGGSIVPKMGQFRICSQERGATDAYGSCRNVTGLWPTVPDAPKEGTKPTAGKCKMICPCVPLMSFPCVHRDHLESVMPAHLCGVTVAVFKPALVGAVSLPDPVPSAGSTAEGLGHPAPLCSHGKARFSTAVEGLGGQAVLTSCGLCCEQRGLRVQGSQGDALCKGKVGTRLYPPHLSSPKELKTDRGTGICPMAA